MASESGAKTRGKKADVTAQTLIDLSILSQQIEGKSVRTLGWYRANLVSFARFATMENHPGWAT